MCKKYCLQNNYFLIIIVFILSCYEIVADEIVKDDCNKLYIRLGIENMFHVGESMDKADESFINPVIDIGRQISNRLVLSIRYLPIFAYFQEEDKEVVFGTGAGGALRFYLNKKEKKGFFSELHEIILLHENKFENNNSNINFYSAVGIGYQFNQQWDIILRLGHISNADLKEENKGTDLLGIGCGYSF
ncbi:MAG: acyloxyacyl hydrolase [bacterium]|nr:acyloxyacyl hydrolase [bacterium]